MITAKNHMYQMEAIMVNAANDRDNLVFSFFPSVSKSVKVFSLFRLCFTFQL